MMVKQADLPKLKHTNAEVLAYLLENRNRRYVRAVDQLGKRLSETELLKMLKEYVCPLTPPRLCASFVVSRTWSKQVVSNLWSE
jgi:hypothetical protein